MSAIEGISYSSLIGQLNRRAHRSVLSQLGFQRKSLNEYLQHVWENVAGLDGSFLSDPVFESTFGYETADKSMDKLSGQLIPSRLIDVLDKPPAEYRKEYSFKKDWYPYKHQLAAWARLLTDDPSSVLVSSGTGSGKTECFLIPILSDLVKQIEGTSAPLEGVQALFLYPLNALIESQQERLSAWSREFDGAIRYCLYNGNTPISPPPVDVQRKSPEQVLSRAALRSSPPPILVTNSTMLEYMLVRQDDQPILAKSQGKLKWVVLDEAHTYVGSNAAEIAMLLRRVMHSFDVKPSDVRFIATSATIGSGDAETLADLRIFLADVAGVDQSQVHVITGHRQVPSLENEPGSISETIDQIIDYSSLEAAERWKKTCDNRMLRGLRNFLTGGDIPQKTLSEITEHLSSFSPSLTRENALAFLDMCAGTRDDHGVPFLPTRLHLFEKTLSGIWACVNCNCPGRQGTPLDTEDWKFGKVFTHDQGRCDCCKMPVFEVLSCSDCGAEYLSAQEVARGHEYFLQAYRAEDDLDEFQLDVDFDDDEDHSTDACEESRRLVSPYGGDRNDWISPDGKLFDNAIKGDTVELTLVSPDEGRLWCACCGAKDTSRFSKLRFKKLGAPFFLGDILPTVLEHCPPGEGAERSGPAEGRRLLTFTDSRQGTARIAARLQQDTDRNFVRSQLYFQLFPVVEASSADTLPDDIDEQIKEHEQHLSSELPATIKATIEKEYKKLLELKSSAGAEKIVVPSVSWQEVAQELTHCREIRQWMRDDLVRLAGVKLSEEEFANFCLFREFARRPKRGNQAETLGLIKLVYPKIEAIHKMPDEWVKWGGSIEDWKDFLNISVDHHIRENSCIRIDHKFIQWMGAKIRVKYLQSPLKERVSGETGVIYWPRLSDRRGRVPRLAGLLLAGFQLDRDSESVKREINHILERAWSAIVPLLDSVSDGYLLDFSGNVELSGVTDAWCCPYTKRILPRVFRGLSPYTVIADDITHVIKCDTVEMPIYPYRHWRDEMGRDLDQEYVRKWIDSDKRIEFLRSRWLWPNRSDRAAEGETWVSVGEHSAQQSKSVLDRLTKDFKTGKMNILSCSTTMEMGVDIGGVSAVAMNNVPPGQANYLQRAGRAGRRKESSSVCVTLCGQSAHSLEVFHNPLWPFDPEGISIPRVALHSRSLVQRHASAFLLSEWLKQFSLDIPKLNCGWFFEEVEGISRCDDFRAWCETLHGENSNLIDRLKALVKYTALESATATEITLCCADSIGLLKAVWQREFGEMLSKLEVLNCAGSADENRVPIRAINFQLKSMRSEYLLKDLTNKGFLPGHGFPSGIVSLLTTTVEDFKRQADPSDETREDVTFQRSVGPTRDRSIGIREFAPGAEVVVNGVVHRSSGITLNRHIPVEVEGKQEIQDISWHWHCRKCGSGDVSRSMPESCSACGSIELEKRQVISPNGFAVDITYERHNDVSAPTYLPFNPPRVNFGGALWKPFSDPKLGRIRSTDQASIMHWNAGSHNNQGYAVCFYCGRAEMQTDPNLPPAFHRPHKRLRGGKESAAEEFCPGSDSDWAIKRNLWLIDESVTSAIELQLKDPFTGEALVDVEIAWTIAYGLRYGLVSVLGITESEVSVRVQKFEDRDYGPVQSIFLYDSAVSGAGYSSQFVDYIDAILNKALDLYDCPNSCDSACNSCLISWDSQHQRDYLNRLRGRKYLQTWKDHLVLPQEYRVFGESSRVQLKPLSESIRAVSYKHKVKKVRYFLGGNTDAWDLTHWSMLKEVNRWIESGVEVQLLIETSAIDNIPEAQRRILASLMSLGDDLVTVGHLKVPNVLTENTKLLATLEGQRSLAWAAIDVSLVPSREWGDSDLPLISAQIALPEFPFEPLAHQQLLEMTSTPPSDLMVHVQGQCDGSTQEFGGRFWGLLGDCVFPKNEIKQIYYRDRYLCTPLQALLLSQIIQEIAHQIASDTEIVIDTMKLGKLRYQPSSFDDNWGGDETRQQVLVGMLGEVSGCSRIDIRSFDRRDVAHSRELGLEFVSGQSLHIYLDEGLSCWRLSGYRSYDFAASPAAQARAILSLEGYIALAHKKVGSWMFVSHSD